jgi:hypothetical protein
MTLKEYLKKYNMSVKDFSSKIGVSWGSLYRNLRGMRMDPKRAKEIEEFTNKEVTKEELMYPK